MWYRFLIAALVCLVFVGSLFADPATFVRADLQAQKITIKVNDTEHTLDARGLKIYNAAGKEIKLEDLKLGQGARLEFKARDGKVTELRLAGGKF
jgi:hypothetical protein